MRGLGMDQRWAVERVPLNNNAMLWVVEDRLVFGY